jgi:glycosyltransferase involved in cell wall biosynthesis
MKEVSIVLCPRENNDSFMRVFNQIVVRTRYDFSKLEIIVVDNNTTPGSQKELEEFVTENSELCSIKYISNNNEGGIAQACNRAIEAANSRWLVYLSSFDTYIYDPRWLQYMVGNLSEEEYQAGYRIAGSLASEGYTDGQDLNVHIVGAIFIAFTDYMKGNPFSPGSSPERYDVEHSARCVELGFQLKNLPRIFSYGGDASQDWHNENREIKRFLIAHLNGLSQFK